MVAGCVLIEHVVGVMQREWHAHHRREGLVRHHLGGGTELAVRRVEVGIVEDDIAEGGDALVHAVPVDANLHRRRAEANRRREVEAHA